MHRHERWHATALLEYLADAVTRSFRRNHADIDASRRNYLSVPDIESVREHQRLTRTEMRLDVIAVEPRLTGVRRKDHDDLRLLRCIAHARDGEPRLSSGVIALRVFAQPDDNVDAAVLQVQRVRVSLTAVADHRHPLS